MKLRNNDKLLIGCTYKSPNSTQENNARLNNMIMDAARLKTFTHVLIGGDFNYQGINWQNETTARSDVHPETQFLESIQEAFLYEYVKYATHFRGDQKPTTIDLVFTNEEGMISTLRYCPPLGKSQHVSLTFTRNCYIGSYHEPEEYFRYHHGHYDNMKNHFQEIEWDLLMKGKTAEQSWETVNKHLQEALQHYVPKVKHCISTQRKPPWMMERVKSKVKLKAAAFRKYRQTKDEKDRYLYAKL